MRIFASFLLFFALAVPRIVGAETISENVASINPIHSVTVLEDFDGKLTYEDIRDPKLQSKFKSVHPAGNELNFGYSQSTYWLKLTLAKDSLLPKSWVLELPYFGLDYIDFYAPNSKAVNTGGLRPISSRPLFYRFYAFPLSLENIEQDFYLRISSTQSISVPLKVWGYQAFLEHIEFDTLFQALYYGGLGALAIFNLFLFIYLRDRAYIYYSGFAFFIGIGIFSGNGYGRLLLWPNSPGWDHISQSVLLGFGTSVAMLFVCEFLKVKQFSALLFKLFNTLAAGLLTCSVGLLASFMLEFSPTVLFEVFTILVIPATAITIYAGYRAWRHGQKSAKFFLLAWGVLATGGMLASFRMLNLVPSNPFTSYALQISSAMEMILFAFALASRIKDERVLREAAQQEALHSKEGLLRSLKASEERLENKVMMRTNDLKVMLQNEKRLREQYIRFGSLISHEFRNPLGIIETQLALLAREKDGANYEKRVSVIGSATHRLSMLFDRWLQGDRFENGIDSLRPQVLPINDWLERLIGRCRSYHSSHVLKFTQNPNIQTLIADEKMVEVVVLNLIDNACKYSPEGSVVTVRLLSEVARVGFSISDTGIGIDAKEHQAIFEEYLQLNPRNEAKGFGLGLAFVKKVVEFHGGSIELVSSLGNGSEFIAWFPEGSLVQSDNI